MGHHIRHGHIAGVFPWARVALGPVTIFGIPLNPVVQKVVSGGEIVGTWRYVGETSEFPADRFTAKAKNYFDLAGSYYGDWWGGETIISVGVTNVLDEDPPISGFINNIAVYSNGNTVPGTWDGLGRYWFVGLTFSHYTYG